MSLQIWIIFGFLFGVALGVAFTWLWWRSRLLKETRELNISVATLESELHRRGEEKDWIETSKSQMKEAFEALASDTLRTNSRDFLRYSRQELDVMLGQVRGDWKTQQVEIEKVVDPLKKNLDELDGHVRKLEQKREGAYRALEQQLDGLTRTHVDLQKNTHDLVKALRSSNVRGQWGEMQLKRIVEMAGMVKNVSFKEQVNLDGGRPDMVVFLPGGGNLPVDAKVPLESYLKSIEETDEVRRLALLKKHEQSFRLRIKELAGKKYWELLDHSPDFVIMFVPNEACLSAAFETGPDLLEWAIGQKVLIASPVTLLALLKSIAYGWQQHQITENAREIAEQGEILYQRLYNLVGNFDGLRKNLNASVESYNKAMGSFESRVIPAARKFEEMGVTSSAGQLKTPMPIEKLSRVSRYSPSEEKDSGLEKPGPTGTGLFNE